MKRMACAVALAAGSGLAGVSALPALGAGSPAAAAAGLQVTIIPPGTVSADAAIPLDLKFNGGNIKVIELFVDGTRLTRRSLTTRDGRGTVHFTLDPTIFTEGSHEVLVKAYEADGTCATTTTTITVASPDSNALAKLEWPKRNSEVQGVVPIKVKIDPSIMDPYVTYTVDNDFLAFRNYAPYVYNWDTGKIGNGVHTIGIEVMDGRTLQVVQKMTLTINVKNVGGFTKIAPPVQPNTKAATSGVGEAIGDVAEAVLPDSSIGIRESVLGLARTSSHIPQPNRASHTAGFKTNTPQRTTRRHSSPGSQLFAALPLGSTMNTLEASMSAIAAPTVDHPTPSPAGPHMAPGLVALVGDPADLVPSMGKMPFGLARQSPHFRRAGAIALRPGATRLAIRPTRAPAPLPNFKPSHHKTFDIALNNSIIKFDVAPRIENGLPLAPFRAIFEHSGGTVKWNNEAKTVRAFDSEHEIEIKIGSREAKVNNTAVSMEATPYLDHGRTIVPISFVRDAMDMKVTFDQETGHLMIEKK